MIASYDIPAVRQCAQYGLDPDVLMGAWKNPMLWEGNTGRITYAAANVRAIERLEQARPGEDAARQMVDRFGFMHFARYLDTIQQYDERDKRNLRCGVVVVAAADPRGSMFAAGPKVSTMAKTLGAWPQPVGTRVYEAATATQAIDALLAGREQYGRPWAFGVVIAHAGNQVLTFGDGPNGDLYADDLRAGGFDTTDAFEPNCDLMVLGCNAAKGQEAGHVVGALAKKFGRLTLGSDHTLDVVRSRLYAYPDEYRGNDAVRLHGDFWDYDNGRPCEPRIFHPSGQLMQR